MIPQEDYDRQVSEMWRDVEAKNRIARDAVDKLNQFKQNRERDVLQSRLDAYRLRPEHLTLLKHMRFESINAGDLVSIGVSGKRPFGNSDVHGDIARILGWKLPNSDLSDEQEEQATQLMFELPYALNEILARLATIN